MELGYLVGFGSDEAFGDHRGGLVSGGGQQVRDLPVGADRAAHRFAVHRDRGQQHRPADRGTHRGDTSPPGQERAQMIGQSLGAQHVEDPLDGVRVRRLAASATPLRPGAEGGQQIR